MNGCYCYGSCGSDGKHHGRGFLTKEEKIEMLNEYKEYLEKEASGVEEKITELQKSK